MSDTANESSKGARSLKFGTKPLDLAADKPADAKARATTGKRKRPMADIIRELQGFKWNFEHVERR